MTVKNNVGKKPTQKISRPIIVQALEERLERVEDKIKETNMEVYHGEKFGLNLALTLLKKEWEDI